MSDKNEPNWNGSIRNERNDKNSQAEPDNRSSNYEGRHRLNERREGRDDDPSQD